MADRRGAGVADGADRARTSTPPAALRLLAVAGIWASPDHAALRGLFVQRPLQLRRVPLDAVDPQEPRRGLERRLHQPDDVDPEPDRRSLDAAGRGPLQPHRRAPLAPGRGVLGGRARPRRQDRKSPRLNSSHRCISYADFCLKKKNETPAFSTRILLTGNE